MGIEFSRCDDIRVNPRGHFADIRICEPEFDGSEKERLP
jgi:hypothetical protein